MVCGDCGLLELLEFSRKTESRQPVLDFVNGALITAGEKFEPLRIIEAVVITEIRNAMTSTQAESQFSRLSGIALMIAILLWPGS